MIVITSERTFVCASCDSKHGGITAGKHKSTHALVRCQPPDASADTESGRATQLNARIDTLETNLKEIHHKVQDSFAVVDDRITVVQDRLSGKLAERLESLSKRVDERLAGLSGRMTSLDERLGRMEGLLLVLGQQLLGAGDHRPPSGTTFPQQLVGRHQTWPGIFNGDSIAASESEFSAWVREMRKGT